MNLSLIWDVHRQVYRAEVCDEADEWGSRAGSWAESTSEQAAVMTALRMAGAIPEKLAKQSSPPEIPLNVPEGEPEPLSLRVAVGQAEILNLLEDAVMFRWTLKMDYTSVDGDPTTRNIEPVAVEQRRVGIGFEEPYLRAKDMEHPLSLVKTFKVSGITRLELVA